MPSIVISGLMVYPLMQEWRFDINETGSSGVRVYQEQLSGSEEGHPENLPGIGDCWDETAYPNCRVKDIRVEYLANYYESSSVRCPRKFTLNYETQFVDTQAMINEGTATPGNLTPSQLQIGIENNSEFITIEPPEGNSAVGFKWFTDDTACTQPILLVVNLRTIRIQQMVLDKALFQYAAISCMGKINDEQFKVDGNNYCEPGTVLFTGYNSTPWRSETDQAKWRVEMTFVHRVVTGILGGTALDNKDGWNFVVREKRASVNDAWWQKPYRLDGTTKKYLYEGTNLTAGLFSNIGLEAKDLIIKTDVPVI